MKKETFSIIMPSYNSQKTIEKSIDSVINQSFPDFLLYIVDDNSTDETFNIIKKFQDKRIIYVKNNVNIGVAGTRNKALSLCKGKYITFLDSDDYWHPQKLEKQLSLLEDGWDVVCSNYYTFRSDNSEHNEIISYRISPQIIMYDMMLKSNFIGNLTGTYNAEKLGKSLQKKIGHEDYLMWLTIMKKSQKAYCIQEPLAYYRISGNSVSSNKFKTILWQWIIYRKELRLPLIQSMYNVIFYIIKALQKRK
ncbi:glycosyltransferase [Xenorhabdus sp. 42]|uniref:glycosyltransferase family 2 protein n=1 Tax=Xenorhabdus szentirmaii TaxID=290112 RepID=UPI0019C9FB2A|nr:glycosyltransferase [Xenorhabdus sp. 42]MBD2820338.1 glycosyltransferase [Xenorhabdus sp. 42]